MDKQERLNKKKSKLLRQFKNSIKNKGVSSTRYAKPVFKKLLSSYVNGIERQFKIEIARKNTKNISIIKELLINNNLNIERIAANVISIVIDKCYGESGYKYNHLCQNIANVIQKEIIYDKINKNKSAKLRLFNLKKEILKKYKNKNSGMYKISYRNAIKRVENEYQILSTLDYETKNIISSYLLQILINSTGLIKIEKIKLSKSMSSLPKRVVYINKVYKKEIEKIFNFCIDEIEQVKTIDDYINFNADGITYIMDDYDDFIFDSKIFKSDKVDKKDIVKDNPEKYLKAINKANNIKYRINKKLLNYINTIIKDNYSREIIFDDEEKATKEIIRDDYKSSTLKKYHNDKELMEKIKEIRYKIDNITKRLFSINKANSIEPLVSKEKQNIFFNSLKNNTREKIINLFPESETLYDLSKQYEEYKTHSKEYRAKVYRELSNIRIKQSNRIKRNISLSIINKLSTLDYFTFNHSIDFRGRLYTNSNMFTYQGDDLQRGIIQYKKSKPIGNLNNYGALIIKMMDYYGIKDTPKNVFDFFHNNIDNILNLFYYKDKNNVFHFDKLINCYDYSIKSETSVDLSSNSNTINSNSKNVYSNNSNNSINSNSKNIYSIKSETSVNNSNSNNTINSNSNTIYSITSETSVFIKNCKDKIQFLSIAMIIADIIRINKNTGKEIKDIIIDYSISNILYYDACNSSLQHSSLIIKDRELMENTNLIYNGTINDVYSVLLRDFKKEANSLVVNNLISRKDIKVFCMTVVYNSSKIQCKNAFKDMIIEKVNNSPKHYNILKEKGLIKFCDNIANCFINILFGDFSNNTFKGINKSKSFISDMYIRRCDKDGYFIEKNSLNFNLINYYVKEKYREIKYRMGEEVIRIYSLENNNKIDNVKTKNSFNANYIHFKDAEHLVRVIDSYYDITTIHDCFGTDIENVFNLNYKIRKELGDMYDIDLTKTPYSFY